MRVAAQWDIRLRLSWPTAVDASHWGEHETAGVAARGLKLVPRNSRRYVARWTAGILPCWRSSGRCWRHRGRQAIRKYTARQAPSGGWLRTRPQGPPASRARRMQARHSGWISMTCTLRKPRVPQRPAAFAGHAIRDADRSFSTTRARTCAPRRQAGANEDAPAGAGASCLPEGAEAPAIRSCGCRADGSASPSRRWSPCRWWSCSRSHCARWPARRPC